MIWSRTFNSFFSFLSSQMADETETSPFSQRMLRTIDRLRQDLNGGLSFEQGKQQVKSKLESLQTCQDFTTEQVGHSLATISLLPGLSAAESSTSIPFHEQYLINRSEMAKFLSSHNYVQLFISVTHALEDHMVPENFNEESQAMFNFYALCNGFMSFSDASPRIADDFGKLGGVELMMKIVKILDNSIYQEDVGIHEKNKRHGQLKILQSAMGILHNCTRHNSNNRNTYREANAVEYFESKICSPHLNIRIGSVLILAQIADEKTTERVAPNLDCVLLLVELLRRAVLSRRHSVNVVGEFEGDSLYSAQELANALTRLAVNDDNKTAIQQYGGVPILVYMLQDGFSDEESLEAFTLLWHLVFMDSIRTEDDIQDIIESEYLIVTKCSMKA